MRWHLQRLHISNMYWRLKAESNTYNASVPALPGCTVDAETRDDAIRLAREAIALVLSRSEIVRVDVPQPPKALPTRGEMPGEWFGIAKDDATWAALFDEIEAHREATRGAK